MGFTTIIQGEDKTFTLTARTSNDDLIALDDAAISQITVSLQIGNKQVEKFAVPAKDGYVTAALDSASKLNLPFSNTLTASMPSGTINATLLIVRNGKNEKYQYGKLGEVLPDYSVPNF